MRQPRLHALGLLVKTLSVSGTSCYIQCGIWPWTLHGILRHRLMPQNHHELAQVWEGLQRFDHGDDAFYV
jgi:hypothetical protein